MKGAPQYCSSSDWLAIRKPAKNSRKGDNGKLLIIAGNEKYHGSAILAILAAVRFCDLVYFHSTVENRKLAASFVKKAKLSTPCVICGKPDELERHLRTADAILVGPGMGRTTRAKHLAAHAIAHGCPVVIDADALHLINPAKLHSGCLLTPHEWEFRSLFGEEGTIENVRAMSEKYGCTILKKGVMDIIAAPGELRLNRIHNEGMTKGGTGDVLAGLAAALLAAGNTSFKSACAAAYLNGYAGNTLLSHFGRHFSAEDLAMQLAPAAAKIEKEKKR